MKYTEEHEWLRLESDGVLTVEITNFAQEQLRDVVYVELPEQGNSLQKGDDVAVVESVKTASDIKVPVSGEVTSVNERLIEEPGIVNSEPTGDGWFFKLKIEDSSELDACMDEAAYAEFIKDL